MKHLFIPLLILLLIVTIVQTTLILQLVDNYESELDSQENATIECYYKNTMHDGEGNTLSPETVQAMVSNYYCYPDSSQLELIKKAVPEFENNIIYKTIKQ